MTEEAIIKIVTDAVNKAVPPAIEKHVNGVVRGIGKNLEDHAREDAIFFARMTPMLDVFERNNITRMTLKKDTGEIVFWVKSVTAIGIFLAGAVWIIRIFVTKTP